MALILAGAVHASSASAGNFCTNVWLAPYGSGGDRCWGPSQSTLNYASVVTVERAGCVDIADGSNNLLASWVCGSAGSSPANAAEIWLSPSGNRKGVIRNNNLSNSAHFSGHHACWDASC